MDRALKRVPLDFHYTPDEPWSGYVNEHYVPCPHCDHGESKTYHYLKRIALNEQNEHPRPIVTVLDAMEAELKLLLTLNRNRVLLNVGVNNTLDELATKHGAPKNWKSCVHCSGTGVSPDALDAYKKWKSTEPPFGAGYQLWDTTDIGMPITPVFDSIDALATWCVLYGIPFRYETASKFDWIEFLEGENELIERELFAALT